MEQFSNNLELTNHATNKLIVKILQKSYRQLFEHCTCIFKLNFAHKNVPRKWNSFHKQLQHPCNGFQ